MCSSCPMQEQIPNPIKNHRGTKNTDEKDISGHSVCPWFVWISFDLRRALAVHHDGIERLTLAEIDEVVRGRLIRVQLDEIFQSIRGDRRLNAPIEGPKVFCLAFAQFTVEVDEPSGCFRDSPGWNLRHHFAEVRPLVGDTAADEHEILGYGFASNLANASLEAK